jgi:hypothetical protein
VSHAFASTDGSRLATTSGPHVAYDDILMRCRVSRGSALRFALSKLCDHTALFAADDAALFDDLFLLFGGAPPSDRRPEAAADFAATIRTDTGTPFGLLTLTTTTAVPDDGREFEFAVAGNGPFRRWMEGEWLAIAFRDEAEPLFLMRGGEALFRLAGDWKKAVSIFLFCRYLRIHEQYLFFHASSVAINGRGVMFIGDKGAGKSTTSLALTARGHDFLGDEVAAYAPSTGMLVPFRRPVGIKPGPRAAAVERGLAQAGRVVAGPGFVRVDVDQLMPVGAPVARPLDAIVFLRPFEAAPRLVAVDGGREHIAQLQPIVSGFLSASYRQRVFELVRMLGAARMYDLHPGQPDDTAAFLEEAFS